MKKYSAEEIKIKFDQDIAFQAAVLTYLYDHEATWEDFAIKISRIISRKIEETEFSEFVSILFNDKLLGDEPD